MMSGKTGALARLMLVMLVLGAVVVASGCSTLHRKKNAAKVGQTDLYGDNAGVAPGSEGDANGAGSGAIDDGRAYGTPQPFPAGAMTVIYFDYDQSTLRSDQLAALDQNAQYLKDHPSDRALIEGHTDERGTVEYNFALGNRRAQAVQAYIIQRGIDPARLQIGSKGEEQPAVPGQDESAWAMNRRVEFYQVN